MKLAALCFAILQFTFGTALSEIQISENKRKMYEGFSQNPKLIPLKFERNLEDLKNRLLEVSKRWYSLHINAQEEWLDPIGRIPNGQDFRKYFEKSLVFGKSPDSYVLTFHELPDYEATLEMYVDPELVTLATGAEIKSKKFKGSTPLSRNQLEHFLSAVNVFDKILEEFTQIRLELEILRDQATALDFEKENGYYVRHLTLESKKTLSGLAHKLDDLLSEVKNIRTNLILQTHNQLLGLVYGIHNSNYKTTTEFKKDIEIFVRLIEETSPYLSRLERNFNQLVLQLKNMTERQSIIESFSQKDSKILTHKLQILFEKLLSLARSEHQVIAEKPNDLEWKLWMENNRNKYEEIYYQLYEILESPAQINSDLYNFQANFFGVSTLQRQLYRGLEALIFGKNLNFKDLAEKTNAKSKLKFRDSIVQRIVNLSQNLNCDTVLQTNY
jgi:hypothetical protein